MECPLLVRSCKPFPKASRRHLPPKRDHDPAVSCDSAELLHRIREGPTVAKRRTSKPHAFLTWPWPKTVVPVCRPPEVQHDSVWIAADVDVTYFDTERKTACWHRPKSDS